MIPWTYELHDSEKSVKNFFGKFFGRCAKKVKWEKYDDETKLHSDNKLSIGSAGMKTTTYGFQKEKIVEKPQYMEKSQKSEKDYTKLETLK